jgi:hypothetical protein
MSRLDDDNLDALLSKHLKRKLDPMAGIAAPAFTRFALQHPLADAKPGTWKKTAGVAAAACVAGMALTLATVGTFRHLAPSRAAVEEAIDTVAIPVTTRVQWTQTDDEGMVLIDDNTPARLLRRTEFEKTRTTHPDGTVAEEVKPTRQDLILVEKDTH